MKSQNRLVGLAVGVVLIVGVVSASVAMAANTITFVPGARATALARWQVNDNSADASGGLALVAAPAAGKLHLERAIISSASAIYAQFVDTNNLPIAGPYYFTTGGPGTIDLDYRLTARTVASALYLYTSGAGAVTVEVEGYTQ